MPFEKDIQFIKKLSMNNSTIAVADIGCGPNKFPNSIGVDIVERPGVVDVVHNLDSYPWPIKNNSFDVLICNHLIEHIDDFVAMVKEFYRILKPNGYMIARTPHYSHVDSYVDPTHKRHMTMNSFNYFLENTDRSMLYTEPLFIKDKISLSFGSGIYSQTAKLLSKFSMRKYEKYWCRTFPANTLYFRLKKLS